MTKAAAKDKPLSAKQQRFVEEYVVDCNATQAAIRAGYAAKHADVQGPQLLGNPRIAAAVKDATAKLSERTGRTASDVIEALWREANREGEGTSHSARVSALGLLGKHFGILVDKVEHNGKLELSVQVTLAEG